MDCMRLDSQETNILDFIWSNCPVIYGNSGEMSHEPVHVMVVGM